jgi:preprotein translocase subunit YajC
VSAFLILILLLFAVFYFVMVRPQRQRQAQHKSMIDNVGVGEDVLTTGGIYGTITEAEGDDVVVEIAPNVVVHMTRRGIAQILPPEAEEEDEDEVDEEPAEAGEAVEEDPVTGAQESVTSASRGNSSADDDG